MYKNKKVAVSVPAHNEERLIGTVIATMPEYVDLIVVVDDASSDRTAEVVQGFAAQMGERLALIRHERNQGVGGAVLSAHAFAVAAGADVMAVMAGDAQMNPAELPNLLDPVVSGEADYAKGNRFINGEAWRKMPKVRFFANAGLSMLNKIAIGYWHISDPQCGYTVLSRAAFAKLDLDAIARGYQFENSLLMALNIRGMRVVDVPIQAIYGIGERSGINHFKATLTFSWFLFKSFITRLTQKYVIRDFHPLVFFYFFGVLFSLLGGVFGSYLVIYRLLIGLVQATSALFATSLVVAGLQFLLFAMWFDKDYDRKP